MMKATLSSATSPRRKKPTGWQPGRILLSRLLILVLAVLLLLAEHSSTEDHGLKDVLMGLAGLCLVLTGIRGRLQASLYIGGRKDLELVTSGPYACCRNPLYFHSGLAAIGVSAASGMLTVVAIVAFAFWALSLRTIRREEARLTQLHGEAFIAYCARVPRFFPRRGSAAGPDLHLFSPLHFHRTFRDAQWFLAAWLLLGIIHYLQARDILPSLFRLF